MSDMTRKEAIEILKDWDGYFIGHNSDNVNEALDMAIASLETDEAYQLEYEKTTKPTIEEFIEYAQKEYGVTIKAVKSDNPDTYEKLFGIAKNDLEVDAISRQAVIDELKRYFHDEYYQRTSIQDCRDCFIEDVLNHLPSVTPIRPKGYWINVMDGNALRVECSKCHKRQCNKSDFCPNCGAKMVEPQQSEDNK